MKIKDFQELLKAGVLVLDGAMGTMIQKAGLTEADFRGERFAGHTARLSGCNDLLCITAPRIIKRIHREYLDAGADIISTDTFNANAISLADYDLHHAPGLVREINRAGAAIAREAAEEAPARAWGGRALVAGSIGPTNKSASISPDAADPALRGVTYDRLYEAYLEQTAGLIEGGADILLFETVFDTLNLKAGLDAAHHAMRQCARELPVMVSATISDKSGRTLTGQTLQAFSTSIGDYPCVESIGLNCSFGPKDIIPALRELGRSTPHFISSHPNAGLPDALGQYDIDPDIFVEELMPMLEERLVNIVGGCCGTTPAHIAALRRAADSALPHIPDSIGKALRVAGLERVEVRKENNFLVVGERCNVAGSRKFLRLIKEGSYDEALGIALKQVQDGAGMIDINMDDPLIDAPKEMEHFLRLYASDPEIARVPVMVDSSDWNVVETALKNILGKAIVNSISLKEGEETFIRKARRIKELGAAVIVMAFDETGQADTYERKIEICRRAYELLTQKCGYKGEDIVFDVNVMAVATGLEEHSRYGLDFIRAVEWVKNNLPGARTSGGISNLSFAFRGRNALREAMHTVFLYHAIAAGLDMAIMNPASTLTYDAIDPHLRILIEDVIFARDSHASDSLAQYAAAGETDGVSSTGAASTDLKDDAPPEKRVEEAIVAGRPEHIFEDMDFLLEAGMKAVEIVEGPLMAGMERTGKLFGEGKMFLPQVVKTARVMKLAVDHLAPRLLEYAPAGGAAKAGKVLLATVKGDVHDIGKNIVAIVLACNNYDVVDLGVMVSAETVVEAALMERPDIICLSGLITPSLAEMTATAEALRKAGVVTPLLVGGATTSALHTALKIAPAYGGPVVHMKDASQNPLAASRLINPVSRDEYIEELQCDQKRLRDKYEAEKSGLLTLEMARERGAKNRCAGYIAPVPACGVGNMVVRQFTIDELMPLINWKMLLHAWGLHAAGCGCGCERDAESLRLIDNARGLLGGIARSGRYDGFGIARILPAHSAGDDMIIGDCRIPALRQQKRDSECLSVADFLLPENDYAGVFMAGAGKYMESERIRLEQEGDSYSALLMQTLSDRLAEASSEYLHYLFRKEYWGYAPEEKLEPGRIFSGNYRGIRPAMGYPMLPDQLLNIEIANLLSPESEMRVTLTENGAMSPASTVSGLYIANPAARYFTIGETGDDQIGDYAARRGLTEKRIREILK